MSAVVLTKIYNEPPICQSEILRYAGCKEADGKTLDLLNDCVFEVRELLTYKACYCLLPVEVKGDTCNFGAFTLQSKNLAENLKDCSEAIIFAATVGINIDRLIAKYGRLSPSRALMLQAIGTERIESTCDAFCSDIINEYNVGISPRFSPGYGDLPLAAQKNIFNLLNCQKHIGLTLTGSLLMSPSKSVTAVVGLGGNKKQAKNKCSACSMKNCTFRGTL